MVAALFYWRNSVPWLSDIGDRHKPPRDLGIRLTLTIHFNTGCSGRAVLCRVSLSACLRVPEYHCVHWKTPIWAMEIAYPIQCLTHQTEDPKFNPQNPHLKKKSGMVSCSCNPSSQEKEMGRSLGCVGWPSWSTWNSWLTRDPVSK